MDSYSQAASEQRCNSISSSNKRIATLIEASEAACEVKEGEAVAILNEADHLRTTVDEVSDL